MARFRGSFQRDVAHILLTHGQVPADATRLVRGKAKLYAGGYQESLSKVVETLRAEGHAITYHPGVRGGKWSGYYTLDASTG